MCGIAGVIAFGESLHDQERIFARMQDAIVRRGPDQRGMLVTAHAALIHTRLAVIDPEHGRQPMHRNYRDEVYSIVYNGVYLIPETLICLLLAALIARPVMRIMKTK